MWHVIDCQPGSFLYVGFKWQVTRQQYLDAVSHGTLPSLLKKEPVHPGSTFFIPAGTIHAIGRGILIAEIQQTSDITYRVDDWGRVDSNGKPRELHTELAVDAINFGKQENLDVTAAAKENDAVELKKCQYFTTNIVEVNGSLEREYVKLDSFVIYMILDGELTVDCEGHTEKMVRGETVLIPAVFDSVMLRGNGKLLEIYIE